MAEELAASTPASWREVFRGPRGRLTVGLLLLEALAAIHVLVVATIMPKVLADLGMLQLYGLAFTMSSLATIGAIPIAGHALDRYGARRLLTVVLALFALGLVVDATAISMPILLVGQFLVGAGSGGLYAISLGTVAKSYPDDLRARVLALLSTMWILPGLIGPPIGAVIADTVGWRWAFVAPFPVLVLAWILIAPALHLVPTASSERAPIRVRWPVQVMVGAGLAFVAFTIDRWWSVVLLGSGVVVCLTALVRIVPPGTLRAKRGIAAISLEAFLLSCGFFAVDAFVTLTLTAVRGLSLAAAGAVLTAATIAWSVGSAWQSGRVERMPPSRLVVLGGALILLGQVGVAAALDPDIPLLVGLAGPVVTGLGMGVAFPTLPLAAMRSAAAGEEAGELSSVLLMDVLGTATGSGLAGGIVAVTVARSTSLSTGLSVVFALGIATTVLLVALAPRIDTDASRMAA
jgi:MFS family permease